MYAIYVCYVCMYLWCAFKQQHIRLSQQYMQHHSSVGGRQTYTYIYIHTYTYIHTYIHTSHLAYIRSICSIIAVSAEDKPTHTHTYINTYIHIHTHSIYSQYMQHHSSVSGRQTYTNTCIHTDILTYTYTYIHTYIHT